jgi:AraC-like DNA-binding protein
VVGKDAKALIKEDITYEKVIEVLKSNSVATKYPNGNPNYIPKVKLYDIVINWIIDNDASTQEACKHFNKDPNAIHGYIYGLKDSKPELYKQVCDVLAKNSYRDYKGYEIYEYVTTHQLSSVQELCEIFSIDHKSSLLTLLNKMNKPDLCNKATSIINDLPNINDNLNKDPRPIQVQVGQYIVNNNATINQVRQKFNLTSGTCWTYIYDLKNIDNNLYDQVKRILNVIKRSGRKPYINGQPRYVIAANYIINHRTTMNETVDALNITYVTLSMYIDTLLKKYKPELYKQVKQVLEEVRIEQSNSKFLDIANYILQNNVFYDDVCTHFNIARTVLRDRLRELKKFDFDKYQQVRSKVHPIKYIEIANKIINENYTVDDLCKHFDMNRNLTLANIGSIKQHNPELYEKVELALKNN